MKRRSGFSLTELSVTLAASSTLMLLAVSMVHHSFHWTQTSRDRVQADRSFDRLQRQFRHDVHWADTATIDQATLRLTLPDEQVIRYEVGVSQITREASARHEIYPVGDGFKLTWSERINPPRVVLTVKRKIQLRNVDMPAWRHIEAVVGYSQRLASDQVADDQASVDKETP